MTRIDEAALRAALARATATLLAQRTPAGHWRGELSSSALSTATASFALARTGQAGDAAIARRGLAWLAGRQNDDGGWGDTVASHSNLSTTVLCWSALAWHNSPSCVPAEATQRVAPPDMGELAPAVAAAEQYVRGACGSLEPAAIARAVAASYGEDRTFSVPILTMCALAGRLGTGRDAWRHVAQLPFELAALPHSMLKALRLPVVSYALPALVAIGQARHHHRPTRNPIWRALRAATRTRTMRLLAAIQPATGGFLEAAPLTSFVLMSLQSLAATPAADDSWAGCVARVTARAAAFLRGAVRPDGSWPIDTDLATWATTLSVLALPADALDDAGRRAIRDWLLAQQHVREHPYTHAAPGGWAWTDLPGGVPDADDTAGAVRALRALEVGRGSRRVGSASPTGCCPPSGGEPGHAGHAVGSSPSGLRCPPYGNCEDAGKVPAPQAAAAGCAWLLGLQNSDGGVPTFCRGWGRLPFDRSSQDLTAHALAAWSAWLDEPAGSPAGLPAALQARMSAGLRAGIRFLLRAQGTDGRWTPLWFGHQDAPAQANPVYGTARVLLALTALDRRGRDGLGQAIAKGAAFLLAARGEGGGWGGDAGTPPSIEETALALDALAATLDWAASAAGADGPSAATPPLPADALRRAVAGGAAWLVEHTRGGAEFPPAPIGLYFAKLWYFERLYPIIFTVSALGRAVHVLCE